MIAIENKKVNEVNETLSHLLKDLKNVEGFVIVSKDSFVKVGNIDGEDLERISRHIAVVMGSSEMLYKRFDDEIEYIEIKGKKHKIVLYNLDDFVFAVIGNVNAGEIKEKVMGLKFNNIESLTAENVIEDIAL
ncbi:Roadblock/LC7 family protein [Methanocaldococcus sp. FS406-22]|uniref:roadblock/LC7 domain-containing protein n=1 Tax=Methanocaldococcus sp. (strain FS406-22) TaxID=644281 RepID=UPI0001BF500A|nr:roadblock/LC7 domain-containing protein [Methanocaldococcus sp. FS406-22]ADC69157.1 Roadblock/LC7 family protein [Methanocaldococcus sp. FS406-22]